MTRYIIVWSASITRIKSQLTWTLKIITPSKADSPASDRFADWENAQSARTINPMSQELLTNQAPITIWNSKFDRVNARMWNAGNACTRNSNRKSEGLLQRARRKHCENTVTGEKGTERIKLSTKPMVRDGIPLSQQYVLDLHCRNKTNHTCWDKQNKEKL